MGSEPPKPTEPGEAATLTGHDGTGTERDNREAPDVATDATQIAPEAATEDTLAAQATVSAPGGAQTETRGEQQTTDEVELPTVTRQSYSRGTEVARGGMGRIVSAHDLRLRRPVALKELLSSSMVAQARFEREALVTARLQHPAIVPVYEAGRWPNGEPFYAMKLVEGRSLDAVIAKTKSFRERLGLLRNVVAVADALAYAHNRGIIHRDLKPANVLVGEFGETVVIDWGLAKLMGESIEEARHGPDSLPDSVRDGLTVDGSVLGTPAYMPPEQARGVEVDARADVYSVGALLYHLLTGASAYRASSSRELLAEVIRGSAPPVREREPLVPRDLAAIVDKAMATDPEARYPTAAELVADLKRFETGQLVSVREYTASALLWRWVKRHAAPVAVAAVALVVMMIFGALAISRIVTERDTAREQRALATSRQAEAEAQRTIARAQANEVTTLQAKSALETDPTAALAWLERVDVDASNLAQAREIAQRAITLGFASEVLESPEGKPITRAVFSPNGSQLAVVWGGNDVLLRGNADGKTRLLEGVGSLLRDLAYAPDGRHLAAGASNGLVVVWDQRTGTPDVHAVREYPVTRLAFSPDSRWLIAGDAGGLIETSNLDTGARHSMQAGSAAITAVAFANSSTVVVSDAAGAVMVLDLPSNALRTLGHHRGEVAALALSPDGTRCASAGADSVVRVWSLAGGAARELRGHEKEVRDAAFSPDGKLLATASADGTVRLWTLASGTSRILAGHEAGVSEVSFNRSGSRIVSASADATVRIWEVATGRSRTLRGHAREIVTHALSPDELLATGDLGGELRIWRISEPDSRVVIAHKDVVRGLDVSPDGRYVVSGGYDGAVGIADLGSGSSRLLTGHEAAVYDVAFIPDGSGVVSVANDRTVRFWGLTKNEKRILFRQAAKMWQVEVSDDSRLVAVWSDDGVVHLRALDGSLDRVFGSPEAPAMRVRFSPNHDLVAFGRLGGHVTLWNRESDVTYDIEGPPVQIMDLQFSPDGSSIAICGHDGKVAVLKVAEAGTRVVSSTCEPYAELAFSRSGKKLAVAGRDFAVHVVDLEEGKSRRLTGHTDRILRMAFLADDTFVASSSADKTIRVWNLATGSSRVLTDHSDGVVRLMSMPDGRSLVSAARDGDVRFWPKPLEGPVPSELRGFRKWLREATSAEPADGGDRVSSPIPPR